MPFGFALQDGSHARAPGRGSVLLLEQGEVAPRRSGSRDIRSAIRDLLIDTFAFGGVYLSGQPRARPGPDAVHACSIFPVKEDAPGRRRLRRR
jgi:hypothetical protein